MEHEMEKEHHDLLTKLKIAVFGNGNEKISLVTRTKELEDNFHKASIKLTVIMVLLLILISVQAPALMAGIRGM